MKLVRPILGAIVLCTVLGGGYYIQAGRDSRRSVLSGSFETQPALLSARVAGRVRSLIAKEGDLVDAGQVLARLEANPDIQDAKALEADVALARQTYTEAVLSRDEQIREQTAAVHDLQAAYDKVLNGARPEEISAARDVLANAQQKLNEAVNGPRPQEIAQARAAARAADENLLKIKQGGSSATRSRALADLEAAKATEIQTKLASDRREELFEQGAVSGEVRDNALADYRVAVSRRKAAEEALADLNSRPEDIAVAEQQAVQNHAQLRLLLEGTRKEEIAAYRALRDQAAQNAQLLIKGNRPEDIEQARAKLGQAREVLRALQAGSRTQAVAEAKSKLDEAEEKARSAQTRTGERTVEAPKAAKIERALVAEGELLAAGTPIYRVSYPDDIYLRIYVPEQQLSKVHVGDKAVVEVDGMAERVQCQVESIANEGEFTPANLQTPEERGRQVFTVRLRPTKVDPRLKAGMSATVRAIGEWTP